MTATDRVDDAPIDAAATFGLRSRGAAVLGIAAWVAFAALGLTSGDVINVGVYVVGLVVLGVGWVLLLRLPGDPMPLPAAVVVGTTIPTAVACSVPTVTTHGAAAVLCLAASPSVTAALLCMRGRIAVCWVGLLAMIPAALVTAVVTGRDTTYVLGLVFAGNVGVTLMVTFFAILVRPRAAQIAAIHRLDLQNDEADAVRLVRDAKVARLDAQVRPLLDYIASGQRLSDAQAAACLRIEAGLRDRIRAPGLDHPELATAVWSARGRGVRVVLLDDREVPRWSDDSPESIRLRDAAIGALTGVSAHAQVTVRILPERRSEYATIVVAEEGQIRKIDFGSARERPETEISAGPSPEIEREGFGSTREEPLH